MTTTFSSIPFLFIYPYMPIFVIFVYDMRAFACGCARVGVCERGAPSHRLRPILLFFLPRTTLMLHQLSLARENAQA